jgi:hypothetical protein
MTRVKGKSEKISIGTLQPGSIYHTMGTVVAKVVTEKSDLQMLVQPYSRSGAPMYAVEAGDAEFAFADINDALIAIAGTGIYKGRGIPKLLLAANVRPVAVGLFVKKSTSIHVMKDLKGKRLPARYSGFPNGKALLDGIMAAAGMTMKDVINVPVSSLIPAVNDFIAGKTDAGFFAVGGPKVAEANAAVKGIRFVPVPNTPEALAAMRTVRPAYYIMVVKPAPPFVGIVKPTALLTFDQVLVVGHKVPDQLVYKVLKVLAENKKALVAGFRPFATFQPSRMGKQFPGINTHPGAVRLYKEKGFWPSDK